MARPIKETPILTGSDAEAFVEEMERVDNMSEETRTANRIKLLEEFEAIIKKIAVCLWIMRLVRLTPDYKLNEFDCGDSDLNDFLFEDAKPFLEKRVANTFILEDDNHIAAYFCLLND